jgi:hypothetical protein
MPSPVFGIYNAEASTTRDLRARHKSPTPFTVIRLKPFGGFKITITKLHPDIAETATTQVSVRQPRVLKHVRNEKSSAPVGGQPELLKGAEKTSTSNRPPSFGRRWQRVVYRRGDK